MKTEILITGQITGNSRLRNAIMNSDCEDNQLIPHGYLLTFRTKESAINALSEGYQAICKDMPEEKGKMSGIRYTRGHSLTYDASHAVILD